MEKTLQELEQDAAYGFRLAHTALQEIRDRKLYKTVEITWEQYLRSRWNKSASWFRQVAASAKAADRVEQSFGVQLANEAAAREMRKLAYRQVTLDILPRVLAKATKLANGEPVAGKHIKAVVSTFCEVLDTGGYVWVGDEMRAFDAAIVGEVEEAAKRQLQYIADSNHRNGWSNPIRLMVGDEKQRVTIRALLQSPQPPVGAEIEIKWRFVPKTEETA